MAPIWDIAVSDEVVYVVYYGIHLVDISDPQNPVEITHYNDNSLSHARGILVRNGLAYVVNSYEERGLSILDVSNPDDINFLGRCNTETNVSLIEMDGDMVYIARENHLYAIDVSNPGSPEITDSWQSEPDIRHISVSGGFVYAAVGEDGVLVVDVSDPEHLVGAGFYDTPGFAYEVHAIGNLVYVADQTNLGVYQNMLVSVPDYNPAEYFPSECELYPAYPNPFNTSTTITYTLPTQSSVVLQVYNTRGQLVDELLDRVMPAGRHSVAWEAKGKSAGLYFVKLESSEHPVLRKVLLVK